MRCIRPIKAGYDLQGKITFKKGAGQLCAGTIEFECRKCIACRLNIAREKAIRCVHEAKMHGDRNIFLTLTYNEENVGDGRLRYLDFELFFKSLLEKINRGLSKENRIHVPFMVTGEYGDENKRPDQALGVIAIDSLFSPASHCDGTKCGRV